MLCWLALAFDKELSERKPRGTAMGITISTAYDWWTGAWSAS